MSNSRRPLDGIKVLDMTQALSGPICTCILADYGAAVYKVEGVKNPDMTRGKNYNPDVPCDVEIGGDNFYAINRNKLGVSIDNRSSKGKEILKRIAQNVDIVISNYRPGVTQKIGIDYETLKQINPRIICCEISAFREKARETEPAFDVVIQAASGILASTGYPDQPPAKVGASITDMSAGLNAVQGILLALLERDVSGEGQLVSVRMQDAAMFMLAQYATPCIADAEFDLGRHGMCHVEATPSNGYKTSDGYILTTPATDSLFSRFCDVLGISDVGADEKFRTGAARLKNRDELDRIISQKMILRTTQEWFSLLKSAGLPASPIYTPKQAFSKAYSEHSPIVATVKHPIQGDMPVIGTVCDLSATPGRVTRRAPCLGEDTREVLRDVAGYTDDEISAFEAENVIRCYKK